MEKEKQPTTVARTLGMEHTEPGAEHCLGHISWLAAATAAPQTSQNRSGAVFPPMSWAGTAQTPQKTAASIIQSPRNVR